MAATTPSSPESRRALITGVGGQDGGYLAEMLLSEGYVVAGLVHGEIGLARTRALPQLRGVDLIDGDMRDRASLERAMTRARPTEVYNLASFSEPSRAWTDAEASANVNGLGPLRLLEIIRGYDPRIRFVQASTSEIFGPRASNPQDESVAPCPTSPYGAAKAYAHQMVGFYRERYGIFACSSIMYNHESPRRGTQFVTRKITRAAARIKLGLDRDVTLGSLESRRDWGYAPDFVRAMSLMARAKEPSDYVIGTGETHSVGEFLRTAFDRVGLNPDEHVTIDQSMARGANTYGLTANPTRARSVLSWSPSVSFEALVSLMVDADLERERELAASR